MSHKAHDLLASLTAAENNRSSSPDHDLFGSIIEEDTTLMLGTATGTVSAPAVGQTSSTTIPTASMSLLASSGLLLTAPTTTNGGLFDEMDRAEEEDRQRQMQEERKMQEAELQRMDQERMLILQQQQQKQAQLQQQQQQQAALMQAQLQQQQLAAMMSGGYGMQQSYPPAAVPPPNMIYAGGQHNTTMTTPDNGFYRDYPTSNPPPIQQQEQTSSMQTIPLQSPAPINYGQTNLTPDHGFYRDHPPPLQQQQQQPHNNTYVYSQSGGSVQTHVVSRLPVPPIPPNVTAGMHNSTTSQPYNVRLPPISRPPTVEPIYGKVAVSEPLLIQPYSFLNIQPPHWTYQVQTTLKEGGCWLVRRRFRHVVTLEEKMREECKGAILPPRPDKHVSRAIEEASTLQTAEFAIQRCAELEVYLNALAHHPLAGKSACLRLFLALQDDMGTAWPEVSNNALTRLGAVSTLATTSLDSHKMPWENPQEMLEDNAELLALASSEGLRMGAVIQAVPKLEGAITLLREYGESAGAVGIELGKLSKEVESASDRDLSVPIEILAGGLLRGSRRQKRLATELAAAMHSFVTQYKLCRYEKLAFYDRRAALIKRTKERGKADQRAQRLLIQQRSMVGTTTMMQLSSMERDATMSDEIAVDAVTQCDVIGTILKSEVNRISFERRTEWSNSMKIICSAMKEASSEQVSVWEATKENFLQNFPQYHPGASK